VLCFFTFDHFHFIHHFGCTVLSIPPACRVALALPLPLHHCGQGTGATPENAVHAAKMSSINLKSWFTREQISFILLIKAGILTPYASRSSQVVWYQDKIAHVPASQVVQVPLTIRKIQAPGLQRDLHRILNEAEFRPIENTD